MWGSNFFTPKGEAPSFKFSHEISTVLEWVYGKIMSPSPACFDVGIFFLVSPMCRNYLASL